jgi:hypothetical protein
MILDIPDPEAFLDEMCAAARGETDTADMMDVLTKYEKSPKDASIEAASRCYRCGESPCDCDPKSAPEEKGC